MKKQNLDINNCFVKQKAPNIENVYSGSYVSLTDLEKKCVANKYFRFQRKYVFYLLVVVIFLRIYLMSNVISALFISLPVLGLILYLKYHGDVFFSWLKKNKRIKDQISGNNDYKIRFAKSEPIHLTEELKIAYRDAIDCYNCMLTVSERLENQVAVVESEYNCEAFVSFWIAVDKVFDELREYSVFLSRLTKDMAIYYRGLCDRDHNFPDFPISPGEVPDTEEVSKKLHQLVRVGLTNYQFAMIREQYITQKLVMANHEELNSTVNKMSLSFQDQFVNLQEAVSLDITKLSKEQAMAIGLIESRLVEQTKILDELKSHFIKH